MGTTCQPYISDIGNEMLVMVGANCPLPGLFSGRATISSHSIASPGNELNLPATVTALGARQIFDLDGETLVQLGEDSLNLVQARAMA